MNSYQETRRVEIGGQTLLVKTDFYGETRNPKEIIIFSNGFAYSNKRFYSDFLDSLAKKDKRLVISPETNGMCIKTEDGSKFDNSTSKNNLEVLVKTIENIGLKPSAVVGHSMGGELAYNIEADKHIMINPLVPVDYGYLGFIARGTSIMINDMLGEGGEVGKTFWINPRALEYIKNFAFRGNFVNNQKRIVNNTKPTWENFREMYPKKDSESLFLLSTQGFGDEFFNYAPLFQHFKNEELKFYNGTHDTVCYRPLKFVSEINNFLNR